MGEAKEWGEVIHISDERDARLIMDMIDYWSKRVDKELNEAINKSSQFAADVVPMKE